MIKVINALLAVFAGLGGAIALYFVLNLAVERLPGRWEARLKPYVFTGPAILVIGVFLLYPAIRTLVFSFANRDSTEWVGFSNYTELLSSPDFLQTLFNTLLWIVIVPAVVVIIGLAVAVLADRLGERSEKTAKSIIFLPMAISMVGAATIWTFVYNARPSGSNQVGLLNAIVVQLGFDPINWLQIDTARLNSLLLM
ncbi:MAG: sugar ABC transporter permease, partial [Geodermatophilaceae bacterium]|nr:sugar ABC transporter permease [Geodermatophilaceae bacterium]